MRGSSPGMTAFSNALNSHNSFWVILSARGGVQALEIETRFQVIGQRAYARADARLRERIAVDWNRDAVAINYVIPHLAAKCFRVANARVIA